MNVGEFETPIVDALLKAECEVILASDRKAHAFLQDRFPEARHIKLKGYDIQYPRKGSFTWHMALQMPGFLRSIRQENKDLKDIAERYGPDVILSDNRYGLHSSDIPSAIITHQLYPITPKPLQKSEKKFEYWFRCC